MVKNHGVNSFLNAYIQKGNNNDELVINHSKTSVEDKCSAPCLMASLLEREEFLCQMLVLVPPARIKLHGLCDPQNYLPARSPLCKGYNYFKAAIPDNCRALHTDSWRGNDWYQRCSRLVYLPVSKLFLLGYVPCLLLLSFLFQQTTIQFCMTFGSRLLPPQFPLPSEKVLINRIAEVSCYLCISSVKN